MSSLSAGFVPADLLKPIPKAPVAATAAKPAVVMTPAQEAAKRAQIKASAQAFEASFLSTSLGSMFEGVTASAPFGGGEGETQFKSFLNDAFAKQMVKAGGIGVASSVQREMLRLQGLK